VTRKRSSGLCRLFRTRAIGRVAVQLCLFLLMANLVAPLAWATQAGGSSHGFVLCHTTSDGTTSDRNLPAGQPDDQMVPHCPLCLVFGGSVWVPPSTTAEIVRAALPREDASLRRDDDQPRGQTLRLRPSPRAPPASA
jgi:hypothetical protein